MIQIEVAETNIQTLNGIPNIHYLNIKLAAAKVTVVINV